VNTSITRLNVSWNNINAEAVETLKNALRVAAVRESGRPEILVTPVENFTELYLSCGLMHEIMDIQKVLKVTNDRFQHENPMALNSNFLYLSQMNSIITKLDLSLNELDAEAGKVLGEALRVNFTFVVMTKHPWPRIVFAHIAGEHQHH
jgi:hypothetical protein